MKDIVWLLSRDFLRLVVLAFVLAIPLAWILAKRWLENFAYRVDVTLWVFLVAGVAALAIATVTVSSQSVKASLANPARTLKRE